jgi:hypothetical protein
VASKKVSIRRLAAAVMVLGATAVVAQEDGAAEVDDAAARQAASDAWRGHPDARARSRVLDEALRERDRWSRFTGATSGPRAALTTTANVFVNLGPTRADTEVNGVTYHEMDSGRARQILVDPSNPAILYLSTAGGGVWKSYDGGGGWEPITDALGTLAIGALAMDPRNPQILYLGFGDPFDVQQPGLVRSDDGGVHWSQQTELSTGDYTVNGVSVPITATSVRDIQVDPDDSRHVLVATNAGLFQSTDASTYRHVMLAAPGAPSVLYSEAWSIARTGPGAWLVTAEGVQTSSDPGAPALPGMGMWSTIDGGQTWSWAVGSLPAAKIGRATLAVAPSTTFAPGPTSPFLARVYLLAGAADAGSTFDVFRSDDSGRTWTALGVNAKGTPTNPNSDQRTLELLAPVGPQASYNQAIAVDPLDPNIVFVGGQLAMIRSMNGGASWAVLSNWLPDGVRRPYVHADFHAFAIASDGTFYAGSDGGIFRSPDPVTPCGAGDCSARTGAVANVTFTSTRNEGLATHLAYSVACAQPKWPAAAATFVAGGLQDNGTRVRKGSTTTFDQVVGGDGIGVAVSGDTTVRADKVTLGPRTFLTSVAGGVYRSTDGGDTFNTFGPPGSMPFFVRFARDVADARPDAFLTFTVAGSAPTRVYRAYAADAAAAWADVTGTLHWPTGETYSDGFKAPPTSAGAPAGDVGLRAISTHPSRAGTWAVVSNRYAYVTSDAGRNWFASRQIAPNDDPVNNGFAYALSSIAFDPADATGQTLYVTSKAADLGKGSGVTDLPAAFGHLYVTTSGGASWSPAVGADPGARLPNVPADVVRFDPTDPQTLYVGTEIGLYVSHDRAQTWKRFGAGSNPAAPLGLPLVEVTDLCFMPPAGGTDGMIVAATYGRGFWALSGTGAATGTAVRGNGDTDFNQLIDGRDLLDVLDLLGADQSMDVYRYQADVAGGVNVIDDADVAAVLAKLGGMP